MKIGNNPVNVQFLAGGGEMGRLIREKDWGKTVLGSPEYWSQSLRTSLSILLNTKFPMFLWWGPELTCFYNDAYRPSLGQNGKHPSILGMKAQEAWTEIWNIIKPLIDQVLQGGEAIWFEDLLVPIYRNGKIEDVYWTFSYSPVNDETGDIAGIVVICTETTDKLSIKKNLEESNDQLAFAIESTELGTWDYNPLTDKFSSNKRLKEWFGFPPGKEIKLQHAINTIAENDRERVAAAIHKATEFSSGGTYNIEYSILHPVTKKETIVHAKGRAWFNDEKIAYRFNGTLEDVTERTISRRKIEQTVTELELFKFMVDNVSDFVAICDMNFIPFYINKGGLQSVGLDSLEQLKNTPVQDFFFPGDVDFIFNDFFPKVLKTGKGETEIRFKNFKTGKAVWMIYSVLLVNDAKGNPAGYATVSKNITERKKIEENLKLTSARFRLLADSMPQHIWTSDPQGNLNYYNQSVFDYSGLTLEQINKDGWIQIVHPDDREENIKAWTKSISTGNDFLIEHRFRKYTGEYRWQLSRAVPQRDENGKIQMWVGTSTDIQEQKTFAKELENLVNKRTEELIQLNESLRKSEKRYHLMVEEVQDYAILYLNRQGIVENWNNGAEKIKGYRADEIIGKSFSSFYTEKDRENNLPQSLLKQAAQYGRAGQEGWRVRKDGSLFWASVVITAVHNEKKEVIGFSKVTHDLTEKKKADDLLKKNAAEVERKNEELNKINKELESFAYISSHDLQEPLRKIQTFATRIIEKERQHLTDTGKEYFKRMQDAALRMQMLIDDLLAYSRTSTSERKYENTSLHKIVEEVKADLNEELQQKNATVEATEMCEVRIIPFQFRQLLLNLISNSLKFADPGRAPFIKIKSEIADGIKFKSDNLSDKIKYCHISISDNGIGFEPQYSEKIFGLFQRLHGRSQYSGTGIGLAIVKKIVENHNGIITARGELNKGATFDIYIPANDPNTL